MTADRRRGGQPPANGAPDGEPAQVLEQAFDGRSLYALRAAAAAYSSHAGVPPSQVGDIVVAVHELAANAICHGAGHGRMRMWQADGVLYCQITDDGVASAAGGGRPGPGPGYRPPWPNEHGRGLWVVREVADRLHLDSGPGGTTAMISFRIGARRPQG
ncbi:MAG: ATP-binding protein [Actinobacteria bacterium]|nr:ATP-binding protein [Actinomycetota bacterium]